MATARWVRYVAPVMVEINCDNDAIGRVVALTGVEHVVHRAVAVERLRRGQGVGAEFVGSHRFSLSVRNVLV